MRQLRQRLNGAVRVPERRRDDCGARWRVRLLTRLSGTLFEREAGGQRRPVPLNEVQYRDRCGSDIVAWTYTDADGRHELCRLPIGHGCVVVDGSSVWDHGFQNTPVVIQGDTILDVEKDP